MKPRDLTQPMSVNLRPLPERFSGSFGVTICVNERPPSGIATVSCGPRGGFAIAEALAAEIRRRNLPIRVATIKCLGLCESGPNVRFSPSNSWFHGIRLGDVPEVADIVEAQWREREPKVQE